MKFFYFDGVFVMAKKKVGIIGASGFAGFELLKILQKHNGVEVLVKNAHSHAGVKISELYPEHADSNEVFSNYSIEEICKMNLDLLFLSLPNGMASEIVPKVKNSKTRIIDLSADYRFKDLKIFEKVYGIKHSDKKIAKNAVYGLPELFRGKIKKAKLVANPGCYATSMILSAYPIVKKNLAKHIVFDCVSGYSGAGREKTSTSDYRQMIQGNFVAYDISQHRHLFEVKQFLGKKVSFTPHVFQVFRGIMCSMHAILAKKISQEKVLELYSKFYENEKFVKVSREIPDLHSTQDSNFFKIGGFEIDSGNNQLITIAAEDNLVKGAAGQAVQNMNLMLGFEETEGLL